MNNTLRFLHNAAAERGIEHRIVRNMTLILFWEGHLRAKGGLVRTAERYQKAFEAAERQMVTRYRKQSGGDGKGPVELGDLDFEAIARSNGESDEWESLKRQRLLGSAFAHGLEGWREYVRGLEGTMGMSLL